MPGEKKAELLDATIESINAADRHGSETDEPEGTRYIQMSDTLAKEMVTILEACKELLGVEGNEEALHTIMEATDKVISIQDDKIEELKAELAHVKKITKFREA